MREGQEAYLGLRLGELLLLCLMPCALLQLQLLLNMTCKVRRILLCLLHIEPHILKSIQAFEQEFGAFLHAIYTLVMTMMPEVH